MNVLLAGGTGLVGRAVTRDLLARPEVRLTSLVRRPSIPQECAIDFEALVADPAGAVAGRIDVAISCLGTTIRTAGSQAAFRRVDHDYVLALARAARAQGARQFLLVSSVGAGGRNFYLSVKGEIERAVQTLGFARVDIVRPGLLLGARGERRPGEAIGQALAPVLNPLLLRGLAKYRGIAAETVAAAIVRLAGAFDSGAHVHHNPELERLAQGT